MCSYNTECAIITKTSEKSKAKVGSVFQKETLFESYPNYFKKTLKIHTWLNVAPRIRIVFHEKKLLPSYSLRYFLSLTLEAFLSNFIRFIPGALFF